MNLIKKIKINKKNIIPKWYIIDANKQILGRMVSKIIPILLGKNHSYYTPYLDNGDYIIIINAKKIKVTGNKINNKIYYWHTGYPGGIKKRNFKEMLKKNPIKIIELAFKGMLPKGILGKKIFKKLKIYIGSKHNHIAQKPKIINI